MKPIIILSFFVAMLSLSSCTEVIDLDLDDSEPSLVIEANLNATTGVASVMITESASFTDPGDYPLVSGAEVALQPATGAALPLTETAPGQYLAIGVQAEAGTTWHAQVTVDGAVFLTTLTASAPATIDSVGFSPSPAAGPGMVAGGQFPTLFVRSEKEGEALYLVKIKADSAQHWQTIVPLRNAIQRNRIELFQTSFPTGTALQLQLLAVPAPVYDYFEALSELKGEMPGPASAAPANPPDQWTGGALGYFNLYFADEISVTVP